MSQKQKKPNVDICKPLHCSRESGNRKVELLQVDLGSLDSVRRLADEIRGGHGGGGGGVDGLVCNAGVWVPMDRDCRTDDGFEVHFGVNHLGHFLLVKLLMEEPAPLLK